MSWAVSKPRIVWNPSRGSWTCAVYNHQRLAVEYGGRTPRDAYWHWFVSLPAVAQMRLALERRVP